MPSRVINMLCLANSRKLGGRCVAGKEIISGKVGPWIRPVSDRADGELSLTELQLKGGAEPQVLDIIALKVAMPKPHPFQSENHVIDKGDTWMKVGRATWEQARSSLDGANTGLWKSLWSSYSGRRDRLPEEAVDANDGSLRLVEVDDLEIAVFPEGAQFGNNQRKVRGRFSLNGEEHRLMVTDPIIEDAYRAGKDGVSRVGRALLCISLSEPYDGFVYKLIAAVIRPPS